jgi:hypothetical protein
MVDKPVEWIGDAAGQQFLEGTCAAGELHVADGIVSIADFVLAGRKLFAAPTKRLRVRSTLR